MKMLVGLNKIQYLIQRYVELGSSVLKMYTVGDIDCTYRNFDTTFTRDTLRIYIIYPHVIVDTLSKHWATQNIKIVNESVLEWGIGNKICLDITYDPQNGFFGKIIKYD